MAQYIHAYCQGQKAENHPVARILYKYKYFVTLVIFGKFLPCNDFLILLPTSKHRRPNLTLP